MLFVAFVLRNLYFIHFELAWQGSTPGKYFTGLRVIERHGGELTPAAIVARNLTREVEFPRGHAGNPMSDEEVVAKFRRTVEPRYGREKADKMLERCWKFEAITNVTELLEMFA